MKKIKLIVKNLTFIENKTLFFTIILFFFFRKKKSPKDVFVGKLRQSILFSQRASGDLSDRYLPQRCWCAFLLRTSS